MLHIKSAEHVSDFTLWVAFDDGTSGNIDLKGALEGTTPHKLRQVEIEAVHHHFSTPDICSSNM